MSIYPVAFFPQQILLSSSIKRISWVFEKAQGHFFRLLASRTFSAAVRPESEVRLSVRPRQ